MSQPIYIVQTREPGEKFKVASMGRGRFQHYYGKYIACRRAGLYARFIAMSSGNDGRYRMMESGETQWNNTQTK